MTSDEIPDDARTPPTDLAAAHVAWKSLQAEHQESAWPVSFAFNLPKIDDQGEDADPLLLGASDIGLVAVFDGMGGAGGTVYQTDDGPRTGAYLASRTARDAVQRSILALSAPDAVIEGPAVAAELHQSVESALVDQLIRLQAPASRLRSKLLRALPTTMALAAVRRSMDSIHWTCQLLWAGDSRVYAVTPATGVHQLTIDDLRDRRDAMSNLREDSVVSNAMSADVPFTINHHQAQLQEPFFLVAATDGCFGYVPSPMHFEHLILRSLVEASDAQMWCTTLQQRINAITGDDASMAVLGVGADFRGFQEQLADRANQLEREFISPLDEIANEVAELEERLESARARQARTAAGLWVAYQPDYERYLAATVGAQGSS